MKKLKTKWLAWAMALVMILGIVQVGAMPVVQAEGEAETQYEYQLLDQSKMVNPTASSYQDPPMYNDGPASQAFDGNPDTGWHTEYNTAPDPYHWIQWGLQESCLIGKLVYIPKTTANNGIWTKVKVEVNTGSEWKEVFNGEMPANNEISFAPVNAAEIKVTIIDSQNADDQKFASAGEINVYQALPVTPEPPVIENPIKVIPETLTLTEGQEFTLEYELTQEAVDAGWVGSWDSANTNSDVVNFDVNTGKGVAVGAGDTTIQAKATLNTETGSTSKYVGCKIRVVKAETESVIVLNGREYTATGLEDAIGQFGTASGVPQEDITSIEFKSGIVRDEDLDYLYANKKWFDYELKSFKIADDVAVMGLSGNEIEGKTFQLNGSSTTELQHVYLGKNVKGLAKDAFKTCRNLITFEAPGLEYLKANSLGNVNQVVEFNFPSLKTIAEDAFGTYSNDKTTKISLPAVETLEHDTFKNFKALEELTLGAVPPQIRISANDLEFAPGVAENLKLNIPDEALEAYKADEGYDAVSDTWYGIKLSEDVDDTVTVKINDTEVAAGGLQAAVEKAKLEPNDVATIEFVSGIVTQEDLEYIETLSYLESLTMNVGDNLQLLDKAGQPTTVLSPETAQLKFAPRRSGSSSSDMETLVLGGFTEIHQNGIVNPDSYMHSISMPDVVTVGDSAFFGLGFLETLNLESAVTIGDYAFGSCKKLETVTMNAVEILGKGSFQYTDNLTKLTLPSTILEIKNIEFGKVSSGNKNGTKIIIESATPPSVERGAFTGIGGTKRPTVTVPKGAIPAYVEQINAQAKDNKVFKNTDIIWNNLYLREAGSYAIEYSVPNKSWMTQWAFVPEGEAVGDRYADALTADIDGKVLAGWNTKSNGSGDVLTAETVPGADMKVYAQLKDLYTVTFKNGAEETSVKVMQDTEIGDKLPEEPAKEGFVFKEWNTSEDGSGDVVDEKYIPSKDITVYAIFEVKVNDITFGENVDHKYIYIKKGETFQLNPVDVVSNDRVEVTYEMGSDKGCITVSETGLITAVKQADEMNGYTQIKALRKDKPSVYTWVNVVVAKEPSVEGIDIMVPSGFTNESILNFENGGYVSGNDDNELTFNVTKMNAEWNEQQGLPIVEWYLDDVLVETRECRYSRPNQPSAGFELPSDIDVEDLSYGEHTVKAIVKGADGIYSAETELTFNYIPVYTRYTEGRPEKGSIVWKVVANDTGVIEIPTVINGQTITSLESVTATGNPATDGGVRENVRELVVPDTVTKISADFFTAATDLEKLTINGLQPPAVEGTLTFGSGAENVELVIAREAVANYMEDAGYNAENHTWHGLALPDVTAPKVTATETLNDDNTVTVTLTANEPIQTPEGWTAVGEDGKTFTKVYTENGSENVTVSDLAGNKAEVEVTVTLIDETAPEVEVEQNLNDDNTVTVTLTANEPIQTPEGWTAVGEDGKTFTKVYTENSSETVRVSDHAGNETEVGVTVTLIDETAPEVKVEQKYDKKDNTVTVTITTNESVKAPEGWKQADKDGKVFTRVYDKNGKYTVAVEDKFGNETKVTFEVKDIVKKDDGKPGEGTKPDDGKKPDNGKQPTTPATGDHTPIAVWGILIISAMAAMGIVLFRRKKN